MSEYQYYEFQAIDRPLTQGEIAELRKLSSRASITPSRLHNVCITSAIFAVISSI